MLTYSILHSGIITASIVCGSKNSPYFTFTFLIQWLSRWVKKHSSIHTLSAPDPPPFSLCLRWSVGAPVTLRLPSRLCQSALWWFVSSVTLLSFYHLYSALGLLRWSSVLKLLMKQRHDIILAGLFVRTGKWDISGSYCYHNHREREKSWCVRLLSCSQKCSITCRGHVKHR